MARINEMQHCFACGSVIGAGYLETSSVKVGDKVICGSCSLDLKRYGFIRLDAARILLPSGELKWKRETIQMDCRPLELRNREIAMLRDEGKAIAELTQKFKLSKREIYRVLKREHGQVKQVKKENEL